MTPTRRPPLSIRRLPRTAAGPAVVALALLAPPAAGAPGTAGTAPQVICAVAPEAQADVRPEARDQVCAALARLLGAGKPTDRAVSGPARVVTLHLTQADGRRLAGWIEWADAPPVAQGRPGPAPAPLAQGRSQPAAAMLPDRAATLPEAMLTRFLTLSLRDARFPL